MKRLFIPLMALLVMFLVAGTVQAATPLAEPFATEEWYLVETEEEAPATCHACVTEYKFVDPVVEEDWYLMDNPIEEKVAEKEVVQEVVEPTLEGEMENDAWYLR